jgi:hypothetical protein
LQALALRSGRSQIALIREAIDAFLQQQQPQGRLARLRQGGGLWLERQSQAVAFLEGTEQPLAISVITIGGASTGAISRCWPRCSCPTPRAEPCRCLSLLSAFVASSASTAATERSLIHCAGPLR